MRQDEGPPSVGHRGEARSVVAGGAAFALPVMMLPRHPDRRPGLFDEVGVIEAPDRFALPIDLHEGPRLLMRSTPCRSTDEIASGKEPRRARDGRHFLPSLQQ